MGGTIHEQSVPGSQSDLTGAEWQLLGPFPDEFTDESRAPCGLSLVNAFRMCPGIESAIGGTLAFAYGKTFRPDHSLDNSGVGSRANRARPKHGAPPTNGLPATHRLGERAPMTPEAGRFASTTVIAVILTIRRTVAAGVMICAGAAHPSKIGPMATF